MGSSWDSALVAHRRDVRTAILDATASLLADGSTATTMAQIARAAGIGRATLYKYYRDLDDILIAWHDRQLSQHLRRLRAIIAETTPLEARIRAVMRAYIDNAHGHRDDHYAALLHARRHSSDAEQAMRSMMTELLTAGATARIVRDDVPAAELAVFWLHGLGAATELSTPDQRDGLVKVIFEGLRHRNEHELVDTERPAKLDEDATGGPDKTE